MKKRGHSGGKKASEVGPPAQPKRCKNKARTLDLRCTKERGHERREIDVVHQAGMFIWRDEPIRMTVGGGASVSHVAEDEASWATNVSVLPSTEGAGIALPPLEIELRDWWLGLAQTEVDRTVPKAVEYGSTDLTDIGYDLARTMGREVTDEEAAELGVFFYLRGKVARWVSAVMDGRRVSDDTLFDIGVYVRMAQRIRHAGGWPDSTKQTGV